MPTHNAYSPAGSSSTPYDPPPSASHQSPTEPSYEPKRSLMDELLPLPSTTTFPNHPSSQPRSVTSTLLHSLRRLASLTIILSFLLTILYYTSFIHPSPHYGHSPDSISLHAAQIGWKNFVNTYGKVLGDAEDVGGLQGAEDGLDAGLDISGVEEQEEGDVGGEGEEGEGLVWEEDEWATEIELETQDHHSHDYAQYTFLRTLPPSHVDVDAPHKRVIFIGDVHGMIDSLQELLNRIAFNPEQDLLLHVGDLIAKGPQPQQVVNFLRTNHARGVRGNHDEKVIEWRNWMILAGTGLQGLQGKKMELARGEYDDDAWRDYIDELDVKYGDNEGEIMSSLEVQGKTYPRSWKWRSEHWKIAREMSRKDFEYFVSLPLAIHLPSLHTVVVHAGLLARDPTLDAEEFKQPWAEMFDQYHDIDMQPNRNDAEVKLLQLIPQNRDPYTLLNVRSVLDNGVITKKSNEGTPWSDIWKQEMARCTEEGKWQAEEEAVEQQVEEESEGRVGDEGIEGVEDLERRKKHKHKGGKKPLPKLPNMNCSPLTVIYGHAAGRGLDIKPFSKGLDSGCVYGRQLTALVLGDTESLLRLPRAKNVRVGDHKGVLIDVDCPKGTDSDPKK